MRFSVIFLILFFQKSLGIYIPEVTYHQNYSKVTRLTPSKSYSPPTQQNIHILPLKTVVNEGVLPTYPKAGIKTVKSIRKPKRQPTPIEVYRECPDGATGQFVYSLSCNQFLNCWHGRGVVQNCAPGTLFNPKTLECDFPQKVECITGPRQNEYGFTSKENLQQIDCPQGFSGLIPNYNDCSKFINCNGGMRTDTTCPPGTLFDVTKNVCDFAEKALCFNRRQGRANIDEKLDFGSAGHNCGNGQNCGKQFYNCNPTSQNCQQGSQNYGYGSSSYRCDPSRQNCQGAAPVSYEQTQNCDPLRQNCGQSQGYGQAIGGSHRCDPTRQNCQQGQSGDQYYYGNNPQSGQGQYSTGRNPEHGQNFGIQSCDPRRQNCQQSHYGGQNSFGQGPGHSQTFGIQNCDPLKQNCQFGTHSTTYTCDPTRENCNQNQVGSQRPFGQGSINSGCDPLSQNCGQNQFETRPTYTAQGLGSGSYHCDPTRQNCKFGGQQSFGSTNCDPTRQNCPGNQFGSSQGSYVPGSSVWDKRDQFGTHGTIHHQGGCDPSKQNCYFGTNQARGFSSSSPTSVQCTPGFSGLEKHPYDCSKFLNCANGQTFVQDCGPGTLFNPLLLVCDFPHNVKCDQGAGGLSNRGETSFESSASGSHIPNPGNQAGQSYGGNRGIIGQNGCVGGACDTSTNNYGQSCSGGSCQHEHQRVGGGDGIDYTITATPPNGAASYSDLASNGTHMRWKDCTGGTCQYYIQKCAGGNCLGTIGTANSGDRQVFSQTTPRIDRYNYGTQYPHSYPNYQGVVTLTTPRTVYIKPKPSYQSNDYEDVFSSQASTYYNRSSFSTTPRTWPPPFPTTDVNADYLFDYEDITTSPKEWVRGEGKCNNGDFKCTRSTCVPTFAVCDRITDCINGNDERGCHKYLDGFERYNNSKLSVMEDQKWDNVSFETCAALCINAQNLTCKSFNYRKIDKSCFLINANIADTGALISYYPFDYCERKETQTNCAGKLKCPNNKCIETIQRCDGFNDCGDRYDEKGCRPSDFGYSVKLVGSKNKNEGSIQVTAFNFTGYICDDQFDMKDANIVCKELGYELGAAEVKANSYYAKDVSKPMYMMDDITCIGNETNLLDCDFSGWGVHNCLGDEVAGVVCKTSQKKCSKDYWQCKSGKECIPLAFLCDGLLDCTDESDESPALCDMPTQFRLANGRNKNEGRVEVRHHGSWGTICDDDFNEDAAKVICGYLGYRGAVQVKKESYFGEGEGPIWLDQVFCLGNETKIEECTHWDWGEHNCDHSEDVGVICSNEPDVERHSHDVKPLKAPYLAPITCGYRRDNQFRIQDDIHYRVVKGSKAEKGDYPWQAALRVKGRGGKKPAHWCGAIVISQKFLLTAAHCLVGYAKNAYIVVAGDYNVDEDEGTEQEAFIEDFYIHEDFRKGHKMNNDIAVIKLKGRGFVLNDDVQPICLADATAEYSQNLNCTISGFGSIEFGRAAYSHDLRAGWIPIQNQNICKMPHVYGDVITDGMVCAGSLDEGVDACDGDSGGPLACLYEGLFTLYGITSWGQHCGYANKPGVYVKVAYYRKWIDDILRKHS